ncbi:MAG: toprim domain-containing protein, partial [Planctomycetota bacterium]
MTPKHTFGDLTRALARDVDPDALAALASGLGVSAIGLQRLGIGRAAGSALAQIGVHGARSAFTFPMVDSLGRVIGVRIRLASVKKLCVKGSRVGLFVPVGLDASGTVFLGEGESDTAALLTLGVEAIGRPGADQCRELITEFALSRGIRNLVVVADRDPAGCNGARLLAQHLAPTPVRVRIITPGAKDVR